MIGHTCQCCTVCPSVILAKPAHSAASYDCQKGSLPCDNSSRPALWECAMRDLLRRQWDELRRNLRPREAVYWLLQNLLLLLVTFKMRIQMYGAYNYAPLARATLLLN